jgi:hypothetical protein
MTDVHNEKDLKVIDLLAQLVAQVQRDAANGTRTDVEPMLNYVHHYTKDVRTREQAPLHCDVAPLHPFLPMLRSTIDRDAPNRIRVIQGGIELNFCDVWCLVSHYIREHNMRIIPEESIEYLKN